MNRKGITVYCASSANIDPVYFEAARELGRRIAQAGLPVINGGGKMGLMGAVTDGALAAGGEAIGVIPQFMVDIDLHHKHLTAMEVTLDMSTRKQLLAQMAIGVVALPGGVGTLEELFETMTNRKLGLFFGEIVVLNINHYFDPLIDMLRRAESEGFSYGAPLFTVAETVDEAIRQLNLSQTE